MRRCTDQREIRGRSEGDLREIRGRSEADQRQIRGRSEVDQRQIRGRPQGDPREIRWRSGVGDSREIRGGPEGESYFRALSIRASIRVRVGPKWRYITAFILAFIALATTFRRTRVRVPVMVTVRCGNHFNDSDAITSWL